MKASAGGRFLYQPEFQTQMGRLFDAVTDRVDAAPHTRRRGGGRKGLGEPDPGTSLRVPDVCSAADTLYPVGLLLPLCSGLSGDTSNRGARSVIAPGFEVNRSPNQHRGVYPHELAAIRLHPRDVLSHWKRAIFAVQRHNTQRTTDARHSDQCHPRIRGKPHGGAITCTA